MIPSITAITVCDAIKRWNMFARNNGRTMKIAIAMITENTITTAIKAFSSFSPNTRSKNCSNFPGSPASSSSSKKLAENVRDLIPSTMESTKLNIPRTNGREKNFTFSPMLIYVSFLTSISPSGLRTAVAYSSPFFIITPSITACPPMPEYFICSTSL